MFEEDKSKQEWLGVWVNTWQYSLLKEDEAAQIEVLKGTIEALNESVRSVLGDTSATWFKFATQLKNSVGDLALAGAKVGMASMGLNPLALNDVGHAIPRNNGGPQKFRKELINVIRQYKEEIRKSSKLLKNFRGFVFFIDDMDRLEPVVAVQILSLLKNLFDVPDCVFILAIDYEVVEKGLEKKFGKPTATYDKNGIESQTNNREFRSYFDKIIQLTFRVPTDQLDLKTYLKDLLCRIDFCNKRFLEKERFITEFANIVESSCGRNPRSIKRLLNSLSLVKELVKICDDIFYKRVTSEDGLLLLSALSALQSVYPKIYDKLRRNPNIYSWKSEYTSSEDEDEANEIYIDEKTLKSDPWQIAKLDDITRLLTIIRNLSTSLADKDPAKSPLTIDAFTRFTSATDAQDDSSKDDYEIDSCEELVEVLNRNEKTRLTQGTQQDLILLERSLKNLFEDTRMPFSFEYSKDKIKMFLGNRFIAAISIKNDGLVLRFGRGDNFSTLSIGQETGNRANWTYVESTRSITDDDRTISSIRDRLRETSAKERICTWKRALGIDYVNVAEEEQKEEVNVEVENPENSPAPSETETQS